jgi:hypothetical protein
MSAECLALLNLLDKAVDTYTRWRGKVLQTTRAHELHACNEVASRLEQRVRDSNQRKDQCMRIVQEKIVAVREKEQQMLEH